MYKQNTPYYSLKIALPIILIVLTMASLCHAEWQVTLNAIGKQTTGLYKSNITIGTAIQGSTVPAPPQAPAFSCHMVIKDPFDWSKNMETLILDQSQPNKIWVIAVNPHGNVGLPVDKTVTISWNSEDLGSGDFEIHQGWDGTGAIVANMKQDQSFTVTGTNQDYYFAIIQK